MANKCNKLVNKTILRLLTLLGVGSATFMFMACYGPAPQSYNVNPDTIDSLTVDTLYDEYDEVDTHSDIGVQTPE